MTGDSKCKYQLLVDNHKTSLYRYTTGGHSKEDMNVCLCADHIPEK